MARERSIAVLNRNYPECICAKLIRSDPGRCQVWAAFPPTRKNSRARVKLISRGGLDYDRSRRKGSSEKLRRVSEHSNTRRRDRDRSISCSTRRSVASRRLRVRFKRLLSRLRGTPASKRLANAGSVFFEHKTNTFEYIKSPVNAWQHKIQRVHIVRSHVK